MADASNDIQVLYKGKWVWKRFFRVFVYNKDGQKLAKSYDEFVDLITVGGWTEDPYVPPPTPEEILAEMNEARLSPKIVDIKSKRGRKCQSQRKG